MLITPKVFGLEKRNCTFWKWQSFSFKRLYDTYASDRNNGSHKRGGFLNNKVVRSSSSRVRCLQRSVSSDILAVHMARQLEVGLVRKQELQKLLISERDNPLRECQSSGKISRLQLLSPDWLVGMVPVDKND